MEHWHTGIITPDIERSLDEMCGLPGAERGNWTIGEIEFTAAHMVTGDGGKLRTAMARVGGIVYELIQPLDELSFHAQVLKTRGPGMHHSAYVCGDKLEETVAMLVRCGGRVVWEARLGAEHVYYVELPGDGTVWELINVCPFMPK